MNQSDIQLISLGIQILAFLVTLSGFGLGYRFVNNKFENIHNELKNMSNKPVIHGSVENLNISNQMGDNGTD